jgi:hypothetical protein
MHYVFCSKDISVFYEHYSNLLCFWGKVFIRVLCKLLKRMCHNYVFCAKTYPFLMKILQIGVCWFFAIRELGEFKDSML